LIQEDFIKDTIDGNDGDRTFQSELTNASMLNPVIQQ